MYDTYQNGDRNAIGETISANWPPVQRNYLYVFDQPTWTISVIDNTRDIDRFLNLTESSNRTIYLIKNSYNTIDTIV